MAENSATSARSRPGSRPRVVIAGGGVAGLETLLALRALAADRVDVTLARAGAEVRQPLDGGRPAVQAPARPRRSGWQDTAAELDARWHQARLTASSTTQRRGVTKDGTSCFDTTCSCSRSAPTPSANGLGRTC